MRALGYFKHVYGDDDDCTHTHLSRCAHDTPDTSRNKAIVDNRLRPRCTTRDKYLFVVTVKHNLVEITAVMLVIFFIDAPLGHYAKL